ncbi:MAG: hypothetical protein PF569_04160 [Candidatus Woesearchaeota archaeon]|jgi:hypothetical protein|nr:hypothetical protein [Candidatus Woesearchaeota archaeon]
MTYHCIVPYFDNNNMLLGFIAGCDTLAQESTGENTLIDKSFNYNNIVGFCQGEFGLNRHQDFHKKNCCFWKRI